MKQILHIALLLCASSLFAQEKSLARNKQGLIEATEVVPVDSATAAQLYCNAQLFVNDVFQNARQSAQIRDEKTKTIATKASFPVSVEAGNGQEITAKIYFTFVVQSKEGVYKYTVHDFYFGYTEETGITSYASFNDRLGAAVTPKQWQHIEMQADAFVKSFVEDLKGYMQQKGLRCRENGSREKESTERR